MIATRGVSPPRAGVELGLLVAEEGGGGRVGDRRDAALEQRGGGRGEIDAAARLDRARHRLPTALRSLRSCARQARRYRSEWLKPSACMWAISSRSSSSSTAASHARSS